MVNLPVPIHSHHHESYAMSPVGGTPRSAHLGWRLLAMVYDSLPVLALWLLVSAIALLLHGGQPIAPWSLAFWLQVMAIWGITGAYAVISWRRGGQTLGMRPWRLTVATFDGKVPTTAQLWRRYALANVSIALAGLGLLWSLLDPRRRCWHDIGSSTQLVRMPKNR